MIQSEQEDMALVEADAAVALPPGDRSKCPMETAAFRSHRGATYRAAVLAGPKQVKLESLPLRSPGASEVRIKLEGCGVCGSNLAVWEGRPWFHYPLEPGAPGHEAWGWVDAVGVDVDPHLVGQRVAALSYHAFAEFDLAPADGIVPLPPKLDSQPFPGEALGCAMNVMKRADIHRGQSVAIVGIGFLGALLTGLAANAGARVLALSRRETSLDIARRMGAAEMIRLDDSASAIAMVKRLTNDLGCERVVEATGFQRPLDVATALTAERGRLVIAGYHQEGMRLVDMQSWNWRGIDVINAHERAATVYVSGIRAAVDAIVSGQLDPAPLYTHRFRLDQLGDALESLRTRESSFLKAWVTYE